MNWGLDGNADGTLMLMKLMVLSSYAMRKLPVTNLPTGMK